MKLKVLFFFLLISFFGTAQHVDTKVISVNEGLFSNNIQKIFIDSKGVLWIGSRAGLFKRKMNTFEIETVATKYKFNNVFDIYEDKNQNMWIAGYGQGVLFF